MNRSIRRHNLDIRVSNLLEDLRKSCRERQREIATHFIEMEFGCSQDEFMSLGREWLSRNDHSEFWREIRKLTLNCSLLIGYADDSEPVLIRVDSDGQVFWEDCYGCIGSGGDLALAYLCQRVYDDTMPIMDCLRTIYSAKKLSENNPYVGTSSSFDIHGDLNNKQRYLTDAGWSKITEAWDEAQVVTELLSDNAYLGEER